MNRVYINNLSNHVDEEVTINGWLYNKRSSGKIAFIIVRDGTGRVQGVVSKSDVSDEVFDKIDLITQESSLSITGTVKEEKRSEGGYEIQVTAIEIYQVADEYPISPKEHGTAFLMDNRHLWLRSRRQHAILKIRHRIIKACRDFFDERDFVLVDTPIFTPTSCEGTTTLFETEYFGRIAYLAQSGQLYSEASAASLGRVYCFGPTFRAEKSKTRRHLTEFWMVEPEVAYSDLEDNMKLAEEFVSYVVQKVLETKTDELKILVEQHKARYGQSTKRIYVYSDDWDRYESEMSPALRYSFSVQGLPKTNLSQRLLSPGKEGIFALPFQGIPVVRIEDWRRLSKVRTGAAR